MHCWLALAFVRTVQFFRPINNERKFIFPSAIFLQRCCFIALSWYVSRWKSYGTTYKSGIRSWSAVHAHYFNDDALLFLQAVGDKHRLEPMLIVVAERLVDRSFSWLLGGKMAYICHGNEHFVLGGPAYFALPCLCLASNMEPSP